jgi:hypothetical protein
MAAVKDRAPRLGRAIQQLAEDHRRLARSVDALIGEVESATGLDERIRDKVLGWVRDVRQHESRENDLVQDAFNVDIGTED